MAWYESFMQGDGPTFLRSETDIELSDDDPDVEAKTSQILEDTGKVEPMSLNLGSLNKSRQNSGGGNRGTENVAVMVAEVHVQDKRAANPAEDYAIVYLLEDAFGKKAEFNDKVPSEHPDYMTPLTTVKLKMRPDVKVSGEFTQPGVWDLQVGKRKGAGMPMGQFPTIVLESAFLDSRTDTVMARWYRVGQRDYTNTGERCLPNALVSVEAERYENTDNGKVFHQYRHLVMPEDARTFSTLAEFKEIATSFLVENPDAAGGRPIATFRILNANGIAAGQIDENSIATIQIYPIWDKEKQARLSPAESVERWLEANPEWVGLIMKVEEKSPDTEGYVFELIPSYRYNTGRDSLPSKKGKGIDDAENFRVNVEDRAKGGAYIAKNNGDGFVMTNGFALGSMIVKRSADDAPWFATNTFRKNRFGPIFMKDEFLTPNLPAETRKVLEARAEARGNSARQAMTAGRDAENGSAPSDDEIPFGEPDHSGGLTPS